MRDRIYELARDGSNALLVARVIQVVAAFAISVAVVWSYGLAGAGTLALAALPAAAGGHLLCLGLQSGLPRARLSLGARATVGAVASFTVTIALIPPICLYSILVAHSSEEAVAIAAVAFAGALGGQNNVAQVNYVMQNRQYLAPIMPTIHLIGIGVAAFAPSLVTFGLILIATRVTAAVVGFYPLDYERTSRADIIMAIRQSAWFTPLDILALLAEQLPVVLLSGLLTREELGLIGLLRQFITVADMPGFSKVFNTYPALVRDPKGVGPQLARDNERLAWLAAIGTFVMASTAAVLFYGTPVLVAALPVVLVTMPARYVANFCDQSFRASGMVREAALLAAGQLVISLPIFALLTSQAGFWGAVLAFALYSLLIGFLYRFVYQRYFPGILRPLRPWRFA